MATHSRESICCRDEINTLEIEGTHVCSECGLVKDMLSFHESFCTEKTEAGNMILFELCNRAEIDCSTQSSAEHFYQIWVKYHPTLNKSILSACAIDVACKKHKIPRSMKEISVISGVHTKQLGKYEQLVSNEYYPTIASDYVNRFGCKIGLKFTEIKEVIYNISLNTNTMSFNPVALSTAYIYKTSSLDNEKLEELEKVSGVPISTIKRISKYI